jgi:hypothetical protein
LTVGALSQTPTFAKKSSVRLTEETWVTYIADYAKDHYGKRAESAVHALVDVSLYLGLDSPRRARHYPTLLKRIENDTRFAEEIELGICHWTGQTFLPLSWTNDITTNGFCYILEEERESPIVAARRTLLPDTSPLALNRYQPYQRSLRCPVRKADGRKAEWSGNSNSVYSGLWAFLGQRLKLQLPADLSFI